MRIQLKRNKKKLQKHLNNIKFAIEELSLSASKIYSYIHMYISVLVHYIVHYMCMQFKNKII